MLCIINDPSKYTGSFSIRRDNTCKKGGTFFLYAIYTYFWKIMELRVKKQKLMFRQDCFANVVSDFKKKMPYWPYMWIVLINIFSVSDVLLT